LIIIKSIDFILSLSLERERERERDRETEREREREREGGEVAGTLGGGIFSR